MGNTLIFFKWIAAILSCFTMVFSPMALGQEAERLSTSTIKQIINDYKLNNKTYKDIWNEKNNSLELSDKKEIEKYFYQFQNQKFPEVKVTSTKSVIGEEVTTLLVSQGNRTMTFQISNEANNTLKINGITFSEEELTSLSYIIERMKKSDAKLRKEIEDSTYKWNYSLNVSTSDFFSNLNPKKVTWLNNKKFIDDKVWEKMEFEERVTYLVHLRSLFHDSERVLITENKPVKSAGFKKTNVFNYVSFLIAKVNANTFTAESCVNAGYIVEYGRGVNRGDPREKDLCKIDNFFNRTTNQTIKQDLDTCKKQHGNNSRPCNPDIYSYNSSGGPYCINTQSEAMQTATHYSSTANLTCDSSSPLSHVELSQIRISTEGGRAEITPPATPAQVEIVRKDQEREGYKLTKDFIEGMLKRDVAAGKAGADTILKDFQDKKMSPALRAKLDSIKSAFSSSILRAQELCKKSFQPGVTHEENQKKACLQLHRRWIFVDEYVSGWNKPPCPDNKPRNDKGECDSGSGLLLPLLIGGGLLAALLLLKNKKKKKQCQLSCGNGTTLDQNSCKCVPNQCTISCNPATTVLNPATCKCDPLDCGGNVNKIPPTCQCKPASQICTPGQKIINANCDCGPDTPKCPNGQDAPNGDITKCCTTTGAPAPGGNKANCTKVCPNGGGTIQEDLPCPEGGTGESCANPPCSGGVGPTSKKYKPNYLKDLFKSGQ